MYFIKINYECRLIRSLRPWAERTREEGHVMRLSLSAPDVSARYDGALGSTETRLAAASSEKTAIVNVDAPSRWRSRSMKRAASTKA